MMKSCVGIVFMVAVATVLFACGQTSPQPAPAPQPSVSTPQPVASINADKGKTLMETECAKCHGVDRVTSFHENVQWKEIVDRMITKHSARISADDAALIIEHLNKTLPRKGSK